MFASFYPGFNQSFPCAWQWNSRLFISCQNSTSLNSLTTSPISTWPVDHRAPTQWETSLQSNAISHWLGANLQSALDHKTQLWNRCHTFQIRPKITCNRTFIWPHFDINFSIWTLKFKNVYTGPQQSARALFSILAIMIPIIKDNKSSLLSYPDNENPISHSIYWNALAMTP